MEVLKPYIPYLIPVALIELGLLVFALVDLIRRERTKGPKWLWGSSLWYSISLGQSCICWREGKTNERN